MPAESLDQAQSLAVELYAAGKPRDAEEACRLILAADTARADTLMLLGLCRWDSGDLEQALRILSLSLEMRQDFPEAYNNRGLLLLSLDRPEEALADFDRALSQRDGYAKACNNRGNALATLGRLEEAVASYRQAIQSEPDYMEAYYNLGNAQQEMLQLDEAMLSYARALELRPDYADAHWNRSLCLLMQGRLSEGWEEYEWRWNLSSQKPGLDAFGFQMPLLDRAVNVRGCRILVCAEQGFGDTLQFARYATELAKRGALVILEVQRPLVSLMQSLPGLERVIAMGEERPPHDFCVPLLSLPRLLESEMESISRVPYLEENRERLDGWKRELGEFQGLRVGLVWSGSQREKGESRRKLPRSLPLDALQPLLTLSGIEFIALQPEILESDRAFLASSPIRYFGHLIKDFADTAALVSMMDVVITIDTATAHLAGAMAKPTWVLLPNFPDWRWFLDRQDSPWYPTARLFRQPTPGEWTPVIADVAQTLRAFRAPAT